MHRILLALALIGLARSSSARADGLLVPTDRSLPPLALKQQKIRVAIDGQVATTAVEQVFRNATDRDLEAEYLLPLPAGAAVRELAMWVGGKRLSAETVGADKARQTYEDIVRRLKDPGLLEYVDRDLCKVRIYPIPRRGEQKIEVKYTSILPSEGGLVAYHHALRTGRVQRGDSGETSMVVELKSPEPLGPIFSPTHDVAIDRKGDRTAVVSFEGKGVAIARDFRLAFAPREKGVGLSLMTWREAADEPGYFLLLLSPRYDDEEAPVPRDLALVLDTSSSMAGEKLAQAKGALKGALGSLRDGDRFALIQFATVVTPFRAGWTPAAEGRLDEARAWVDRLEAQGATDIGAAIEEAMKFRDAEPTGRAFQVLFLTDGCPTAGVTDPAKILESVSKEDAPAPRLFTFGVGDDVNAHLLDGLAEATRASSTYVRPGEDLERKTAALVETRHPARTDLALSAVGRSVRLVESYPPRLPDLFRGDQLQVVGRYEGSGPVALQLESRIGKRLVAESFEATFPARAIDHDFIPPIWARRKVGYLLDQIRLHGESEEVRDEVTRIGRAFGIATPYTSLLLVPDEPASEPARRPTPPRRRPAPFRPMPPVRPGLGGRFGGIGGMGGGMGGMGGGGMGGGASRGPGMGGLAGLGGVRGGSGMGMGGMGAGFGGGGTAGSSGREPKASSRPTTAASGKAAIDLAQQLATLKGQGRVEESAEVRSIGGRTFRNVEGAWIDETFDRSCPTLKIKAFGPAYFRLLERHPEIKEILALGDRAVWISPSGTALVVDKGGADRVADAKLDRLFQEGR